MVNQQTQQRGNSGDWKKTANNAKDAAGFVLGFIPTGKLAAALTWLGAWFTTYILFYSVSQRTYWSGDLSTFDLWLILSPLGIAAAIYQFVITIMQRGYWSGEKSSISRGAMVLETITNAAAFFPFMRNLDVSGIWNMFNESLAFWPEFNMLAALAISLLIGYIMAGAPEYLWKRG